MHISQSWQVLVLAPLTAVVDEQKVQKTYQKIKTKQIKKELEIPHIETSTRT